MRALTTSIGLLLTLSAASSTARPYTQAPDATSAVAFEAASVRPDNSGDFAAGLERLPGGRFNVTNLPLAAIIGAAYALRPFELYGGPAWLTSDRWNIVAKMAGDPSPAPPGAPDVMNLAMRTLLADRFKLVGHRETREVDAYALVVARADGRLGPGLRPSTTDCGAVRKAADEAARTRGVAPSPNTPERVVCGVRNNGRRIQVGGYPMTTFAETLSRPAQRLVVDRTGLTGDWELDMSFAPELGQQSPAPGAPPVDPGSASVFTSVQEQLGLKLEPTRVSMEVMVVDRVERPVAD